MQQGVLLGQQATCLNAAAKEICELHAQVTELTARLQATQTDAAARAEPFRP